MLVVDSIDPELKELAYAFAFVAIAVDIIATMVVTSQPNIRPGESTERDRFERWWTLRFVTALHEVFNQRNCPGFVQIERKPRHVRRRRRHVSDVQRLEPFQLSDVIR